ncbi:MAG: phosphatase PAP2 family protein [Rhodoplanes sp.]|uniref:phosphatase PAP2 family protein n=1 Tax=Rhodoplanes sp. TaxID=1968906 RepID=UPI00181911D9|nr:phosphatase PAP2 family protein [Rhodoplanes sp.]NVO17860.1 phosphatase PAP2 family protein [Rhodoplanes sp.]
MTIVAAPGGGPQAAPAALGTLRVLGRNLAAWLALLAGRPRKPSRTPGFKALVVAHRRQAAVALLLILATMLLVDPFAPRMRAVPRVVVDIFEDVTDFGRSGWILIPAAGLILWLAALLRPSLDRVSRAVLAAVVVRLGFVFVAVGLPGLVATILKRWIGRLRPSELGPYVYAPLSWRSEYASLPSGHTVTSFAALVAIGAVWPAARPVMWIYALSIALSRILVSAHFPSDVLAGAAFGAFGAILVREWFAARRLGFVATPDGGVRALPGPSGAQVLRALAKAVEP